METLLNLLKVLLLPWLLLLVGLSVVLRFLLSLTNSALQTLWTQWQRLSRAIPSGTKTR